MLSTRFHYVILVIVIGLFAYIDAQAADLAPKAGALMASKGDSPTAKTGKSAIDYKNIGGSGCDIKAVLAAMKSGGGASSKLGGLGKRGTILDARSIIELASIDAKSSPTEPLRRRMMGKLGGSGGGDSAATKGETAGTGTGGCDVAKARAFMKKAMGGQ